MLLLQAEILWTAAAGEQTHQPHQPWAVEEAAARMQPAQMVAAISVAAAEDVREQVGAGLEAAAQRVQ